MEAKELRIGNYIQDNDSKRIGYVLTIGSKKTAVKMEFSKLMQDIEEFEPIPLTEEWLRNFAFVKVRDYPVFRLNGFQVEFNGFDSEWGSGLVDKKTIIKYVHQLQNIYFCLFGEELTLKN